MPDAKVCTACSVLKPLEDFVRRTSLRSGRGSVCKPCQNKYLKRRRQEPRVQQLIRDNQRAHRGRKALRSLVPPVGLTKCCIRCHLEKPLEEFSKNLGSRYSRGSWCCACASEHNKNKMAKNQASLELAKNKPCADCGRRLPSCCMDFDHVDGVKRGDVSRLLSFSLENLLAEILKCEVVCACCHRIRTSKNKRSTTLHHLQRHHQRMADLKSAPCMDCGDHFPSVAMDYDHVRGVKFRMISTMANYSWERVLNEVSKCDLVCANCHRLRTQARRVEAA